MVIKVANMGEKMTNMGAKKNGNIDAKKWQI